jgi:hypothetical protein
MSRIQPLKAGESPDPEVNQLLEDGKNGWWEDPAMFGVIAKSPELLKGIIPAFEAFFAKGHVEPHIFEMMRLITGKSNDCAY